MICDWSGGVTLEQVGPDRVLVKGGRGGLGRTDSYKVSATHADGWRAVSTLTLAAIDAPAKAERVAEAILTRCRRIFRDRNMGDFRQVSIEVLGGAEAAYGANARARTREVVLKIGAVHDDRAALNIFAGEIAPMAISTAQGLTGFFAGRPKVQPVVRLFSFLQSKAETPPVAVEVDGKDVPVSVAATPVHLDPPAAPPADSREPGPDVVKVRLVDLAWGGRSGDKGGDIANIGILARKPDYLPYIRSALSEEVVKDYFAHVCDGRVERFDLPGSHSLNFLLHDSLGGGGIASVRIDPQGKGFAQMLLDIEIPVPADLAARDGLNAAARN